MNLLETFYLPSFICGWFYFPKEILMFKPSVKNFSIFKFLFTVIPQQCRYRGIKYECGLSISCVLGGGRPLDLCSGGMIWACCIDREPTQHVPTVNKPEAGIVSNASEYKTISASAFELSQVCQLN